MLRTALRPKSLILLLVCLSIATVFVLLSRWQLSSSEEGRTIFDPGKEVVQPLQEAIPAGQPALASFADQAVEVEGTYRPDSQVLVAGRLQDGDTGWWVVDALTVSDSAQDWPDAGGDVIIPVVRGWVSEPQAAEQIQVPQGDVVVVGRFLPPEAPLSTERTENGAYRTLSPAQLTNVWAAPVYSGFVTADAESLAADGPQLNADGTLPADGTLLSPQLDVVQVDQQPTDTSVNWLNLFYAVEWIVFAAFALWIWFRSVADTHRRETDPESWFVLGGEETPYYWDESSGRYYYYDPVAETYYFFDGQQPHDGTAAEMTPTESDQRS
ncbi:SURF1 family cytochrome oxidase biogenesis protein [Kocuria sp.]|uniref:SURF1 family cytochrome oxidase biogenesis protein n=1 Tax=Kocuria sp. TaxID=1871328 RepID=UPI0026E0E2F5|nr:SURF1 family cytochrome oxidase biogenesis protein [Kocuria sp.]MDO5617318.1 SURF1 family cytochrome oxidase biogenesis protein [Kocuria sp.]